MEELETAADFFRKRVGKATRRRAHEVSSHRAQTRSRAGRHTPIGNIPLTSVSTVPSRNLRRSTGPKISFGSVNLPSRYSKYRPPAAYAKCRFSVRLRSISYEFFTDRSGLPDVYFAMFVSGVGTVSSSNSRRWGMRRTSHVPPPDHGSHRLSNDLFSCLRLPSFRPGSMDARHEAQDDNSSRG